MSVRTPLRLAAVAPVALAATLLAGCGSAAGASPTTGGGSPATAGGGSQPQSVNSGSGGTSVSDGLGHPVNVCTLLPAATVASVSGEPITVAQEQDTASYKLWTCNYTSAAGTSGLDISVLAMDAVAGYNSEVQANATVGGAANYQSITGLGDKAFSSITGVEALFGNVSISVSNLASETASVALIRDLQPKL